MAEINLHRTTAVILSITCKQPNAFNYTYTEMRGQCLCTCKFSHSYHTHIQLSYMLGLNLKNTSVSTVVNFDTSLINESYLSSGEHYIASCMCIVYFSQFNFESQPIEITSILLSSIRRRYIKIARENDIRNELTHDYACDKRKI